MINLRFKNVEVTPAQVKFVLEVEAEKIINQMCFNEIKSFNVQLTKRGTNWDIQHNESIDLSDLDIESFGDYY